MDTKEPGLDGFGRDVYASAKGAVDDATIERLRGVSVATAWSVLNKAGILHPWMSGVTPLSGPENFPLVGRARTLRYLPLREDLLPLLRGAGHANPQRHLFELVNSGDVVVIDAMGQTSAGTLGDILATRLKARNVAGIVTDGCVRDAPFIKRMGIPVFTKSVHPGANTSALLPFEYDGPVQCGGVTVLPGDIILGDEDGVVVIPAHLASKVADHGLAKEHLEGFLRVQVENGESLRDAYPPGPRLRAAYEAWCRENPHA